MSENNPLSRTEADPHASDGSAPVRPCVITINVSMDGVAACRQFLESMPDRAAVFLFCAQELQPAELESSLASPSAGSVSIVTSDTDLTAGRVYIVPPKTHLILESGAISIAHPLEAGVEPLDIWLASVAEAEKHRAIVLFFTEWITHCLEGIKSIRENHGLILHLQEIPLGMPMPELSAFLSCTLDGSLPLQAVIERVRSYVKSLAGLTEVPSSLRREDIPSMERLFMQVREETGIRGLDYDLIHVLEHLQQRLRVYHLPGIAAYVDFVATRSYELVLLARRLAMRRTTFFPETETMERLLDDFIPALLEKKDADDVVRVWVPDCGTGEEAVALAILLNEAAAAVTDAPAIQVIGTDANPKTLHLARRGRYTRKCVQNIPPVFRKTCFVESEGLFHLGEPIARQLQFLELETAGLPPFSNLDVIYARCVLKPLKEEARRAILENMRKALGDEGLLVLGDKDVARENAAGFEAVDKHGTIYRKAPAPARTSRAPERIELFRKREAPQPESEPASDIAALHKDLVLHLQGATSLMITPEFAILDQIGHVEMFVAWPNNGQTLNLLEAFPEALRQDLSQAVKQSLADKKSLQSRVLQPGNNGVIKPFRLQIHPLQLPEHGAVLQVLFLSGEAASDERHATYRGQPVAQLVNTLEAELRKAREQLSRLTGPACCSSCGPVSESEEKLARQNAELKNTNQELLALNRDLVRRVEQMRKNMQSRPVAEPKPQPTAGPEQSAFHNQFLALVAQRHELRTALTSIIGFADLLGDRIMDPDNKELARYIGKAGHRLSDTLSVLLDQDFEAYEVFDSEPEPETVEEEETTNRLLVVEDSDATRRLLSLVLSDRFECELAADANEAIEKAEKELFKAVVLDINLGKGKTGVEVLHYLRQNARYQRVPFMAVTALASPQDESMLLGTGFDAYVAKPFQKAKLLTTLDRMLSQGNAA